MTFNPVDYYSLVSWLYKQKTPHEEACIRTIVSKAYYSAFLEARNRAGIIYDSGGVHKKVRQYYYDKGKITLANWLDDLRIIRNNADYDTARTLTHRDSQKALTLASKILQEFGVCIHLTR